MAIKIDDNTVDLIERFLGLAIRQAPSLAAAGAAIIGLFKGKEIDAAEMAVHRATLEAADAELQAAIDKRLGR